MKRTRRSVLKLLTAATAGLAARGSSFAQAPKMLSIRSGPFKGSRESLREYEAPGWYRDAKFGIWAHWGPQSGVEQGDWYARNMYIQGSDQYKYHVGHYGHPSKFGYKDLCPLWKAADFDPEHLMDIYQKAGAKYFVSMGVHHDNFDLWNSKYNRWNAVKMGPQKDIVGMWKKAATARGLRFGVSEHLWISYKWFGVSHGADQQGIMQDVPYDGQNTAFEDLYHQAAVAEWARGPFAWNDTGIPDSWRQHWFLRMKDLVDNYQPDLLYTDGHLPFEDYGTSVVANLYNVSAQNHQRRVEAVYTSKLESDCATGTCVLDFERGLANQIRSLPWQTDTCIGGWHYDKNLYVQHKYKTAKTIIDLLVDIVSQNGNLLLNFPLPNNGVPDSDEMRILEEITKWMAIHSEGIHGTRPWKIYGEGPSTLLQTAGAGFNEGKRKPLTADDIRFTTKGDKILYVFMMGSPQREVSIQALGINSPQKPMKVMHVDLLGYFGPLQFQQEPRMLRVQLPPQEISTHAVALRVTFG